MLTNDNSLITQNNRETEMVNVMENVMGGGDNVLLYPIKLGIKYVSSVYRQYILLQ